MPNFVRIPYSVYEIFNSFKLLSHLSYRYYQPFVQSLVTSSFSSRTIPQPTVPMRRLRYCQLRQPTSSAHWIGHRTVQISVRWTMRFGTFCRNESTAARSVTSTIWKNDWLKSGVVLVRTLLTEQWICGVIDCINVWKGDTLNIWFEHFDCSDLNCAGNSWLMKCYLKIHISVILRRIAMKLCSNVCNRCRLVCLKFYLNRISFAVVIAKCLGGSLIWDTL